jgi:hypothetical protein
LCQRNRLDIPSQIFVFGNKRIDNGDDLNALQLLQKLAQTLDILENPRGLPESFHIASAIVHIGLCGRDQNAAPPLR